MSFCSACGHAESVHFFWVGCCGVHDCLCEGTDGAKNCRQETHGDDCWWATLREPVPEITDEQIAQVLELHHTGLGTRPIGRQLGIRRPLVMATIRDAASK